MENDAAAVPGYVNRPTGHAPECRPPLAAGGWQSGGRPAARIALVALRAYEQRAERRVRMRAWMIARAAAAPAGV